MKFCAVEVNDIIKIKCVVFNGYVDLPLNPYLKIKESDLEAFSWFMSHRTNTLVKYQACSHTKNILSFEHRATLGTYSLSSTSAQPTL